MIVDEGHELGINKNLRKNFSTSSSAAHRGSEILRSNERNSNHTAGQLSSSISESRKEEEKDKRKVGGKKNKKISSSGGCAFSPATLFIFSISAERR